MRVGVTEARLALGFIILPPVDAVLAFMHRALWPENPWEVWAHPHGAAMVLVESVVGTLSRLLFWVVAVGPSRE